MNALASAYETLRDLFPHVRVFLTEKNELPDFILVASESRLVPDSPSTGRRVQWLLQHESGKPSGQGIILHGGCGPLESRQTRKAEPYRKLFMERAAFELLLR